MNSEQLDDRFQDSITLLLVN